jgi:hypothetical protein
MRTPLSCGVLRGVGGSYLPTFRETHWSPLQGFSSSRRKPHPFWTAWPLKMEPIGCPETSVNKYRSTPRNIPEERRSRSVILFHCISRYFQFSVLHSVCGYLRQSPVFADPLNVFLFLQLNFLFLSPCRDLLSSFVTDLFSFVQCSSIYSVKRKTKETFEVHTFSRFWFIRFSFSCDDLSVRFVHVCLITSRRYTSNNELILGFTFWCVRAVSHLCVTGLIVRVI